jgi:endonuclease YncB( thermonuclease family)
VLDGDTVELVCPGQRWMRARIVGYDSPELRSPGCEAERAAAVAATRALGAWVRRATRVEVAVLGRDRYGRRLVDMRLDGRRVAQGMVEAGHGRRYFGRLRGGWCG